MLRMESHLVTTPPPPRYQQVADMLRAIRKRSNLTQEDLAHRLNMTLSGYRPYEQGKRNLKIEQIPALAEATGLPISDITSLLWPEERSEVATAHFSADLDELRRQVAGLPPALAEAIIKGAAANAAIMAQGTELARRN